LPVSAKTLPRKTDPPDTTLTQTQHNPKLYAASPDASLDQKPKGRKTHSGEGGIRTPDAGFTDVTVFETAAFNHSATSPRKSIPPAFGAVSFQQSALEGWTIP
jgi:hypothetical protein